MKVWTSYFYAVRFMKPNQIPVSTAVFDPKWFHKFKNQSHIFLDKNGVVNGLRSAALRPGKTCEGLCSGKPCAEFPVSCGFLTEYRKQIFALNRDKLLSGFFDLAERLKFKLNFSGEAELILLVHEAPDNQCSERRVLQDFFNCAEFNWRFAV